MMLLSTTNCKEVDKQAKGGCADSGKPAKALMS